MARIKTPGPFENPYPWWHPFLARRWEYVQALHREYGVARAYANEFELETLVPDLLDRSLHLKKILQDMVTICRDDEIPLLLAAPLRAAINPQNIPGGPDPVAVTRQYLAETEKMIVESFMKPFDEIDTLLPVTDAKSLVRFLRRIRYLAESVRATKDKLFSLRLHAQLYLTNRATGQVIVTPAADHDVILSYFRIYLDQLVGIADAVVATIDEWKKSVQEDRKPFLEFAAAHTTARTSRWTIGIQLLTIGIAISLSFFFLTARDPYSLVRENARLRGRLQELETRLSPTGITPARPSVADGGLP